MTALKNISPKCYYTTVLLQFCKFNYRDSGKL
jgi:hypothetical protein